MEKDWDLITTIWVYTTRVKDGLFVARFVEKVPRLFRSGSESGSEVYRNIISFHVHDHGP